MESTTRQTLGHYTLNTYLGGTALASVYSATDTQSQREVAIKVLRPYLSRDPSLTDQFLRAMEQVQRLRHPLIHQVYEAQRVGDLCYVAIEYTPWESLRTRLQRPLSLREALAILAQVAQAVEYALSQGFAHRNLKPTNIFVGPDLQILVSDFGMDVLSQGYEAITKTELSTPMAAYRAPEHTQGAPVDPYTDIYSLGVLAYEMLTATLPFNAINPSTVLVRQLTATPAPPSRLNTALPPEVDRVLLQALARQPERRYRSPSELVSALEQVLNAVPLDQAILPPAAAALRQEPSSEVPTEVRSLTEPPVTLESREGLLQICPVCDEANDVSAAYCIACWGRLIDTRLVDLQEAEGILQKRTWQRRRRRITRIVLIAIAPLVLLGMVVNAAFFPPPPPPPVTDPTLNSDSRPGEWAMLRGSPARSGFASLTTFLPQSEVVWTFESEPIESLSEADLERAGGEPPNTPIFASPAIVDGVVFLPTGDRRVVALDATTGELQWEHHITGPVSYSPAIAEDLVYVGLRDGRLLALDKATGELRWQFVTVDPILSSPVVHEGTVYISSMDGRVNAIDAATGDLRWEFHAPGRYPSSPAVNHAVVAFTASDNRLHILDRETGLERLAYAIVAPTSSPPAIQGSNVITSNLTGAMWAVDWRQTQNSWERRWYTFRFQMFLWGIINEIEPPTGFAWDHRLDVRKDRFVSSVALAQDKVFQCTLLGRCTALDPTTGEELWRHTISDNYGYSSPVVVGDVVYVGANNGNAYGLDANTGEEVWVFTTGAEVTASPVFANGMLYVASQDGTLYAIR